MKTATQQQCINHMLEQLEGYDDNRTAKVNVWSFAGEPKNFITKAEKSGLECVEKHNDDLVFRLKSE